MNFKEWIKLQETPLDYYGHQYLRQSDQSTTDAIPSFSPKPSNPSNPFAPVDRRLIEKDKTRNKLEEVLSRTPFHWNILFIENPRQIRNWDSVASSKLTKSQKIRMAYHELVDNYIKTNNVQTAGKITFVKSSSTGDPLTPWMIAHTIGHALDKVGKSGFSFSTGFLNVLRNHLGEEKGNYKQGHFANKALEFLIRYSRFKSAKNTISKSKTKNSITEMDELVYEMVADYLFNHGVIRLEFNPESKKDDIYGLSPKKPYPDWVTRKRTAISLNKISTLLSNYITSELQKLVGKIIYDDE